MRIFKELSSKTSGPIRRRLVGAQGIADASRATVSLELHAVASTTTMSSLDLPGRRRSASSAALHHPEAFLCAISKRQDREAQSISWILREDRTSKCSLSSPGQRSTTPSHLLLQRTTCQIPFCNVCAKSNDCPRPRDPTKFGH